MENLYIYFDGVIIGIINDINYIENSKSLLDNVPIYYLSLSSETFKDKNELLKDFKNYNIDQKKEPRFFYENNDGKCYVHEINEEFLRLIVHGILHLLGYDDIKRSEKIKMKKLEDSLVKKFCYLI